MAGYGQVPTRIKEGYLGGVGVPGHQENREKAEDSGTGVGRKEEE